MKIWTVAFIALLSTNLFAQSSRPIDLRLDTYIAPEPEFRMTLASTPAPSSPPLEYFSLNTLFLHDRLIVHIGHDLINQNYVVFPSPNIEHIKKLPDNKLRVTIQQYFPELEKRILDEYKITSSMLHYLNITSYEVYDQKGVLVDKLFIPEGVQYRPPQFYQLDVSDDTKVLSFVVGFSGRSAWSDSGTSSNLQGVFQDLRDISADQSGSIKLEVAAASGFKAYEVLTSNENVRISQILSNFHFIAAWGRFAQRDDFLKEIVTMKNFENINIDLSKGVEDLKRYPEIFGNPLDPKWTSVIHKISSSKLTESERKSESSVSAKLGVDKLFSFGGDASKKQESRLKEMVQFDAEGDFYVPKSIHFSLRTDNVFSLLNDMVLQVFDHIDEGHFQYGSGLSLSEVTELPAFGVDALPYSGESALRQPLDFACPSSAIVSGFKSTYFQSSYDRKYQYQCSSLTRYGQEIPSLSCTESAFTAGQNFTFECAEDSFLVGEKSAYVPNRFDRSRSFKCCSFGASQGARIKKNQCQWSPWVNEASHTVSYTCPAGTQAAGVQSEFAKAHHSVRDRKFRFECCQASDPN